MRSSKMRQWHKDSLAAYLYYDMCGGSMSVIEKLLLTLPDGYLYEYLCQGCAKTVGDKKVSLSNEDRILL